MTMNNIKVGDRFVKWRLGYNISCTDGLPEHLHKFYEVFIVEKVNKVTFVANGEKYKEVDKYWFHNVSNEKLEKLACSEAAKYFMDQIGGSNRYYHNSDYKKLLSVCSPENLEVFRCMYDRKFEALKCETINKLRLKAKERLEEVLGGK